jgi:NADH-quinone oxidoreductase subunit A
LLVLASYLDSYLPVGLLLVVVLIFTAAILAATRLVGPSRDGAVKGMTYESGMTPIGTTRKRFNVRFYVLAMTFLLFDVEIIFLYPWATTFTQIDAQSPTGDLFLGRILFFLLATIVAYAYAWRKGVFRFD